TTVFVGTIPLASPPSFLGTPVPAPDILSLTDRFESRNEFFGAQVGLRGEWTWGRLLADATVKVGIGATKQWINNTGNTELTGPAGRIDTFQAGLYAGVDNRGLHSLDEFTFITEVGCRVGYQLTAALSAYVGYTLLYWDGIARPGAQMNPVINTQVVPSNSAFNP